MKIIILVLCIILLYIFNEYHQNKIFTFFYKIYYHRKFICLIIPIILFCLNPELLKKLYLFFQDIDNKPTYSSMTNLMNDYYLTKNNNNKMQYKPNFNNNNINNTSVQNNSINNNITKVKRKVSESKKKYIASNQKWRCAHCTNLLDNTYEVDHIIALYRGGTNELDNLEALCRNCHGKKTFKEKMGI